jgi:hypothetical protein
MLVFGDCRSGYSPFVAKNRTRTPDVLGHTEVIFANFDLEKGLCVYVKTS